MGNGYWYGCLSSLGSGKNHQSGIGMKLQSGNGISIGIGWFGGIGGTLAKQYLTLA